VTTTITIPSTPVVEGAFLQPTGSYYWAAGSADISNGIFVSMGVQTNASALTLLQNAMPFTLTAAPTSIIGAGNAVVWGDVTGNGYACLPSGNQCNLAPSAPQQLGTGRVDDMLALPGATGGFAVVGTVVQQVNVDPLNGIVKGVASVSDPGLAGDTQPEGYYAHTLALNNKCVFYTTKTKVGWAVINGQTLTPSAGQPLPAGGTAYSLALAPGPDGKPYVWYAFDAPIAQGGGIYQLPLPVECGGTGMRTGTPMPCGPGNATPDGGFSSSSSSSGSSGTSGSSGGKDSGAMGCSDPGAACSNPAMCCSNQCNVAAGVCVMAGCAAAGAPCVSDVSCCNARCGVMTMTCGGL
jgi:hypothetical protein